jgi:hypothetical protein
VIFSCNTEHELGAPNLYICVIAGLFKQLMRVWADTVSLRKMLDYRGNFVCRFTFSLPVWMIAPLYLSVIKCYKHLAGFLEALSVQTNERTVWMNQLRPIHTCILYVRYIENLLLLLNDTYFYIYPSSHLVGPNNKDYEQIYNCFSGKCYYLYSLRNFISNGRYSTR